MQEPPQQPVFTVDGNRLTLLDWGPRRFDALLDLIDGATRDLRVLYYIYADDDAGHRVNAALIAAARRGVRVALIVDGFGSGEAVQADFFDPLKAAGVAVCKFSARFGRRYLLRNHQKLALADADTAPRIIVGGFNIEDDYFGTPADAAWRDLGLLIEGPTAGRLAAYFDALDEWVRKPKGKLRHLNHALTRFSETEGATRWLIGGPTRKLSPWARAVRDDMRLGRSIDIIAGYFTPSPTILRRLDRAGRRTDTVRVVTAAKSDNNATIAAARFTYRHLLRHGVHVFEYQPTKLHTKLYVIDDAVHVGSANFDMRSLFINLELMIRIEDKAFADHVHGYVNDEIAQSVEVTLPMYKARTGWMQRLKQFAAYFVVAVVDPNVSRGLNFGIDE